MLKSRLGLALFASAAFVACGSESTTTQDPTPSFQAEEGEIIGGFATSGYEAVGTVGIVHEGKYYMLCSATLVSQQVVLTAKHCAIFLPDMFTPQEYWFQPLTWAFKLAFATGNAVEPSALYDVVDLEVSPVQEGGFVGLGNDVAVMYLGQGAKDVKTIAFSTEPPPADLLGKKAIAIGYGSQTNLQDLTGELNGTRKVGQTTVSAYEGKVYEFIFGSYEAFLGMLAEIYGQDAVDECLADQECKTMVEGWYNDSNLLSGYELWTSKQPGDAVTCHGDSGGPLLKKLAKADGTSQMAILGVVSGGMGSDTLACDYGTVYATLGPQTQDLLKRALSWTDPCSPTEGVTVSTAGSCEGTVATRCTTPTEGPRRLSVIDCAELDQTCGLVDGLAGCVDPETGEGTPTTEPTRAPAPTPNVMQGAVERAAIGKTGSPAQALFAKFKR